jgi:hypothetical protein
MLCCGFIQLADRGLGWVVVWNKTLCETTEGRMESKGLQAHKRNPLAGVFMRMSRMFLRHGTEKGSVWRPF